MTVSTDTDRQPIVDEFERYYREKLWSWIPALYKDLDDEPPANHILESLIDLVSREAAEVRRDADRLWDDASIELADEWAIAYIAALVGATPVSEFNSRGQRLAVANAIRYQRRKGTLTVLQDLIRDIGELEGKVVEAFRRLFRFPHRLDVNSLAYGNVTGTPSGGFLDMRSPRVAGLQDTAFDEGGHLPDVRRQRGPYGWYGIRKLNFHLYPYRSYEIRLATPYRIATRRYAIDPSGRAAPLFQRGQSRVDARAPEAIREVDLPAAISCRRFNSSRHRPTAENIAGIVTGPGFDELEPLFNVEFSSATVFLAAVQRRLNAGDYNNHASALLNATRQEGSFKSALWGDFNSLAVIPGPRSDSDEISESDVIAADLTEDWGAAIAFEPWRDFTFDPDTGQFRDLSATAVSATRWFVKYHVGAFAAIGAGGFSRTPVLGPEPVSELAAGAGGPDAFVSNRAPSFGMPSSGTHVLTTSKTYDLNVPPDRRFTVEGPLRMVSSDQRRPYIRIRSPAANRDISILGAAVTEPASLSFDGLWFGFDPPDDTAEIVAGVDTPATPRRAEIRLDGVFDEVRLLHVSLDPGGERIRGVDGEVFAIPHVRLRIRGFIKKLIIERSIVGQIWESIAEVDACSVGKIEICDSIVHSFRSGVSGEPAIRTRYGEVHLTRTTVIGNIDVARLYASDSLVVGRIRVTDNQHGCFRYSATADYVGLASGEQAAILPQRYESSLLPGSFPEHILLGERFGDPEYAVLSETTPDIITSGASNGSEMGAFNQRGKQVLLEDLRQKVREYAPLGLVPQFLLER